MKYLIIIVGTILVVFVGFLIFMMSLVPDIGDSTFRKITLTSQNKSSKLFIKSENWGLMGDSQITVISTDEDREFAADSTREFVFKGLSPFLYKTMNDTLFIYSSQIVQVPPIFNSKWTVKQIEIENPEMMTLRDSSDFKKF